LLQNRSSVMNLIEKLKEIEKENKKEKEEFNKKE